MSFSKLFPIFTYESMIRSIIIIENNGAVKVLILITILLSLSAFNIVLGEPIKMACNHFPPLKIENPIDGHLGFDVEVLKHVFQQTNLNLNIEFLPWKRALLKAKTGEFDGLCSCSFNKERSEEFYFSDEIGRNSIGFFSLNELPFKKLEEYKDLKIGVVRGYTLEQELIKVGIKPIAHSNELNLLKMLELKRIDAIYSFRVVIRELKKDYKFIEDFNYREIYSAPYFTCFSKAKPNSKKNVEVFNEKLNSFKNNSDYAKLKLKYGLNSE